MAKLNDLQLGNENLGGPSFEDMPDQMGSYPDPPQPGPFRFRLPPVSQMGDIWDAAEKTDKDGKKHPRIKAKFDQNAPLLIVQSPGGRYDNEPFQTTLTNVERRRGKDEGAAEVSDLDYLFRDGFKLKEKPKTNKAYAETLLAHGGKDFGADVEWSWRCRQDKNIRVPDENDPNKTVEVEGQLGCGKRYYQKDVEKIPVDPENPNSPKEFPLHITCAECGADLRAFPSLGRFRP